MRVGNRYPIIICMHIFFSGIGGTGIGPLALVAKQAGFVVSGSDKQESAYIDYLHGHGVTDISIGQTREAIAAMHERVPIDWYVYSSAVAIEQPDAPEFTFCRERGIRMSKRDELLNHILTEKQLKLIAVAGTHGKTTTTAMAIWTLRQLGVPIGYILPAKSSFADMGALEPGAEYFVYECDEYDRNFLHYRPTLSLITGIDWDHPDVYPTREEYYEAFRDFIAQSDAAYIWRADAEKIGESGSDTVRVLQPEVHTQLTLAGEVNRKDAALVAQSLAALLERDDAVPLYDSLNQFPGVSRRFEQIAPGLYSDYAHTPEKIRGALQLGHEVAGDSLVVVYEGLHNTRQHFIRSELTHLFDSAKQLYIVPSYLAREDPSLELLTPQKLREGLSGATQSKCWPSTLDAELAAHIRHHLDEGDIVLCLSAGGGGSLDEWVRQEFRQ